MVLELFGNRQPISQTHLLTDNRLPTLRKELGLEIIDDAGEFYHKDCTIKFTDKSIKIIDGEGSRDESWDNTEWMNEFLNNNPEALEEAVKSLCSQGLVELKEVLNELAVKGWI